MGKRQCEGRNSLKAIPVIQVRDGELEEWWWELRDVERDFKEKDSTDLHWRTTTKRKTGVNSCIYVT